MLSEGTRRELDRREEKPAKTSEKRLAVQSIVESSIETELDMIRVIENIAMDGYVENFVKFKQKPADECCKELARYEWAEYQFSESDRIRTCLVNTMGKRMIPMYFSYNPNPKNKSHML